LRFHAHRPDFTRRLALLAFFNFSAAAAFSLCNAANMPLATIF